MPARTTWLSICRHEAAARRLCIRPLANCHRFRGVRVVELVIRGDANRQPPRLFFQFTSVYSYYIGATKIACMMEHHVPWIQESPVRTEPRTPPREREPGARSAILVVYVCGPASVSTCTMANLAIVPLHALRSDSERHGILLVRSERHCVLSRGRERHCLHCGQLRPLDPPLRPHAPQESQSAPLGPPLGTGRALGSGRGGSALRAYVWQWHPRRARQGARPSAL